MVKLDRIYTRGGDAGETSLGDGERVSKDSPRIWAYGSVDELGAAIGVARTSGLQPWADNLLRQGGSEGLRADTPAAEVRRAVPDPKPPERARPASQHRPLGDEVRSGCDRERQHNGGGHLEARRPIQVCAHPNIWVWA